MLWRGQSREGVVFGSLRDLVDDTWRAFGDSI